MIHTNIKQGSSGTVKGAERRLQPRYPVGSSFSICATIYSAANRKRIATATMRDLSVAGVGFEVSEAIRVDDLIVLPIVPPETHGIESLYRAVRVESGSGEMWTVGAELICVDPDERVIRLQLEVARIRRSLLDANA